MAYKAFTRTFSSSDASSSSFSSTGRSLTSSTAFWQCGLFCVSVAISSADLHRSSEKWLDNSNGSAWKPPMRWKSEIDQQDRIHSLLRRSTARGSTHSILLHDTYRYFAGQALLMTSESRSHIEYLLPTDNIIDRVMVIALHSRSTDTGFNSHPRHHHAWPWTSHSRAHSWYWVVL